MANSILGEHNKMLEYRQLIANMAMGEIWTHLYGNILGQLPEEMTGKNNGSNTIFFIPQTQVPREQAKDVTYSLIICLIQTEKIDEPDRTRLVMGGGRVHYPSNTGTPTADFLTVNLLINSIISTPGAKIFIMGVNDFYLNTPW